MYEVYSDTKRYYIITDKYTGGELFDKIVAAGHFTERDAASVMKQLLSVVMYCHNNNIVHRDLKPENLVLENLSPDSPIKVIDFGYSRIFLPEEHMGKAYGTPFYIAPEIIRRDYNEKCDVWSCGVILYVLLCGSPPFYGANNQEIVGKVEKGEYRMRGMYIIYI